MCFFVFEAEVYTGERRFPTVNDDRFGHIADLVVGARSAGKERLGVNKPDSYSKITV